MPGGVGVGVGAGATLAPTRVAADSEICRLSVSGVRPRGLFRWRALLVDVVIRRAGRPDLYLDRSPAG
jgi:hypothetical protein